LQRSFVIGCQLVAATTTAGGTFTTTGAFPGFVDVQNIGPGHRITVQRHDWIRQSTAHVRPDPGLEVAASTERKNYRTSSKKAYPG
jgi:hypothetical protein